jgi:hypothetical protein
MPGAGEHITRTMLARAVGEALNASADPHEVLQRVLVDVFWSEFSFVFSLCEWGTDQLVLCVGRDVSGAWGEGV